MSRRWRTVGLTVAAVALLAGGIVLYSRQDRDQAAAPAAPQPIPVIATTVQQHEVPIVLTGLGTVTALNATMVRSQITGQLVSVDFKEGQFVKKGDLLAQIDPRTYQAQLDEAEATLGHDQAHLHNGELNLQRYAELVKEDSASRQLRDNQQAAVDELNAQIKIDEAAIENDKAQLSYTRLVAPFDGVTGFRLLDVGSIMTPPRSATVAATTQSNGTGSDSLVSVTQLQPISVIFALPTTSIPEVQDAMAKGTVQAIAFSQDDRTQLDVGNLLVVNNQADPGSGTIQLKAEFPNSQHHLWPGEFVNVQLVISTLRNGLTVPLDAIQQGPEGRRVVFVVGQDHKVAIRPVSMRQSLNGEALIDQGLSAGETVVVRGQYRLSPGTLVTLANPNDPNAVPNPSTASSGMLP
ncbi:MAG: efflux RND transporter periplasmic adaptor subunit [Roseiarcus sp.]